MVYPQLSTVGATYARSTVRDAPVYDSDGRRDWFAAFTAPQNEHAVVRHLDAYRLESFLPTYETIHVWKNRQRKKIVQPLFPCYVFICVNKEERRLVFRAPGVLRIVGGTKGPIAIAKSEIEFLREQAYRNRLEPFRDLVIGERVRIKAGPMQGIEGVLVRKKNSLRFVVTLTLINQHAALDVAADELEPVYNA